MDEPQYKFMTFRNLEEPPPAVDPSLPPFQFADFLELNSLPFSLVTTRLERDEAAAEPDAADFYPEGPLSGPPFVVFYDFITTKAHLPAARKLAAAFKPGESQG